MLVRKPKVQTLRCGYLLTSYPKAHSLRDAGTRKKLAALITLDTLSADTIAELKVRSAVQYSEAREAH